MITRITTTEAANKLIDELKKTHGDLMFHQSGGCCDGSAPMCFPKGEFYLGNSDVEVGIVNDVHFYMSATQFEYWEHTHLTLDAIKGTGGQFSVERVFAPRKGEICVVLVRFGCPKIGWGPLAGSLGFWVS